jgi:hypothetical protein
MEQENPNFDSQIITKGAAQNKLDKSIIVNIRQGTSKKEVIDIIRHFHTRNYKVSDIRVSHLRPIANSLPHILDIAFVKCDVGISPSIIELPVTRPLATSTPVKTTESLSLDWSQNLSHIDTLDSFFNFDFGSDIFSPQDFPRDNQFANLTQTIHFSLRDFKPIRLFDTAPSAPIPDYFNISLPSDDDSFQSAHTASNLQVSLYSPILNLINSSPSTTMATDTFKAKFKMSPPLFGGSYKEDVRDWVDKFERAARINSWMKEEEQARFFPCFLTGSANIWYENLDHAKTLDMTKFKELKDALIRAFDVTKIHDALEYELRNRRQQPDEEVSHYYYDVIKLCRRVNPKMSNETVTRHLMFGLSEKLVPLVIMQSNATPEEFLANAVKAERAQIYAPGNNTEMAKLSKQMEELACSLTPKINEIKADDSPATGEKYTLRPSTQRDTNIVCFYCKKPNHMIRECHARMRKESQTARGGGYQNNGARYFYPTRDGQRNFGPRTSGNFYNNRNSGYQNNNYNRNFPPVGSQRNNYGSGNRRFPSRPQQYQQRPLLPPHVQRNAQYNARGATNNVNMLDSAREHHAQVNQESKNE